MMMTRRPGVTTETITAVTLSLTFPGVGVGDSPTPAPNYDGRGPEISSLPNPTLR